jgi:hypothetical protein
VEAIDSVQLPSTILDNNPSLMLEYFKGTFCLVLISKSSAIKLDRVRLVSAKALMDAYCS